jgi:hypothetical protein
MRIINTVVLALGVVCAAGGPAAAQPATSRDAATDQSVSAQPQGTPPGMVLEGAAGWAGFGDEGIIHHTLIGAAWRGYVTRRISLGPELQFMAGPGSDRDLILTGNVMVDLLAGTADRPRRTTPYAVLGGGLFRHTQRFPTGTSTSTEGAFTAGLGLRAWVNERVYVAADARLGWEPHLRVAALVGVALK